MAAVLDSRCRTRTHAHAPSRVAFKNSPPPPAALTAAVTSVAEEFCEQRVRRGDHRSGLGGQLVEQPRDDVDPASLGHTEPRRHAQTGQAAWQRHRG